MVRSPWVRFWAKVTVTPSGCWEWQGFRTDLGYGQSTWHYHLVDVEALAAGALGVEPPWDSEGLSRGVGVNPDAFERHTALADARWAKAVYEAALAHKRASAKGGGA